MIKFFIPDGKTLPLYTACYVDDCYVAYDRQDNKIIFSLPTITDKDKAMSIVKQIIDTIVVEYSHPEAGDWYETISTYVVEQDSRISVGTTVVWNYRIKDIYE